MKGFSYRMCQASLILSWKGVTLELKKAEFFSETCPATLKIVVLYLKVVSLLHGARFSKFPKTFRARTKLPSDMLVFKHVKMTKRKNIV